MNTIKLAAILLIGFSVISCDSNYDFSGIDSQEGVSSGNTNGGNENDSANNPNCLSIILEIPMTLQEKNQMDLQLITKV